MSWPWVSRKTLEREQRAARERLEDERKHARNLARAQVREARAEADDILTGSLLPFVRKWTHADARMVGDRVQVAIYVHAKTIDDLARDPAIADHLGRTLGGQFAAELRALRLIDLRESAPPRRLW